MLGVNLLKEATPTLVREGISWLEKAANQGFAGAHRQLGYLYKDGASGLPKDEEKSRRHFFAAAQIEEDASVSF
jgi:TPR repeat protein